jgi:hypothetical protein
MDSYRMWSGYQLNLTAGWGKKTREPSKREERDCHRHLKQIFLPPFCVSRWSLVSGYPNYISSLLRRAKNMGKEQRERRERNLFTQIFRLHKRFISQDRAKEYGMTCRSHYNYSSSPALHVISILMTRMALQCTSLGDDDDDDFWRNCLYLLKNCSPSLRLIGVVKP